MSHLLHTHALALIQMGFISIFQWNFPRLQQGRNKVRSNICQRNVRLGSFELLLWTTAHLYDVY